MKHGQSYSVTYRLWLSIKTRCYNPKAQQYKWYGGRGITMYGPWVNDFMTFHDYVNNLGPKPLGYSLDRINNNGGYEPGNLRWANAVTQRMNNRYVRRVTYNGQTHSVKEWEEILGFRRGSIQQRLTRGWSDERALRQR